MLKNEIYDKEYDEYKIAYTLMVECLSTKDIHEGIKKTLDVLCNYINADCSQLLKLDSKGEYHVFNNVCAIHKIQQLEEAINKIGRKLDKGFMGITLDDEHIRKIITIPIETDTNKYLIIIVNDNISTISNSRKIYELMSESFSIILKKMEDYDKLKRLSEEDVITGFGNRLAYSKKIEEAEKEDDNNHIVYTIVDIFRLKYVNDNFGHKIGDLYIQKVAEILQKYFPEFYINTEIVPTGDYIYRIGGDEFAIISSKKDKDTINKLLEQALEEIKNIVLTTNANITTAMNYGIAERNHNESMDELYQEADRKLSDDKKKMYLKLGINRRK